ncbi:MAG: ABC transporter substrate-binding protein [Clostridiales bacterium]|uniref:metal ABC transporter solute-binding protein, Zn/Mn family n=1 Tax=Aminipila sp. TaxID=2060095 RepID=UPI001DCD00F4|nr:zinc ABC transporter substrate-binding protein [Aminipila sp.]MBE6033678.1 ABC transporter substrate-binding protein [Clostridiales bacterium]
MKIKKRSLMVCLAVMISLLAAGCTDKNQQSEDTNKSSDTKPMVAVTIVPEKTFVEAVCGDLVDVITLVPPGSSPENYEPTPREKEKFSEAAVYFAVGVPTEAANILAHTGDVKVVALQDKVSEVYPDRTFESGERDPHIWLSPKRVKVMVQTIAEEMGELDKENKEVYAANAEQYIEQLNQLDKDIEASLKEVKNRKFIVYHPAFGYIAEDYNLQMYALEEEGKESTIQHLQEMIDLAKAENIKVIFYQEEIDSSQSQAFAEEIGGETMKLEPLAADYIENLKKMARTMAEVMQ